MDRTFPHTGPITADLRIANGSLDVVAGDRADVHVTIDAYDGSNASQNAVTESRIEFTNGHLQVSAPAKSGWRLLDRARLRVRVELPPDATVSVKNAAADVTLNGRYRDVVIHTASGDIHVDEVTGDTSVNSASGRLSLGAVGGDARVHSASGRLAIRSVAGSVVAHSASGSMDIGTVGRDVRANTASGDVSVAQVSTGTAKVQTASGDVTVGVAAGTGVWLDLNTASGRTTSDLAMSGGGDGASATLNLKVRTASGDITVRRVVSAESTPA